MHRRVVCLVVGMMMVLTACHRRTPAAEPMGEGFTCRFEALYSDLRVAGTLRRQSVGTLTLEFTEPDTLDGLSAQWDGEKITFSLHGLTFSVDPASIPESALGEEVITALDAVQRGEGERTVEDGKLILAGNGSHGVYTLTCDAQSGIPLLLSVPSLPLEVNFSNVTQ